MKCSDKWLQRSAVGDEDSLVYSVSIWYEGCPNDEYSVYSKLCNKTFSITNIGFDQIESLAKKRRGECKA